VHEIGGVVNLEFFFEWVSVCCFAWVKLGIQLKHLIFFGFNLLFNLMF